MIYESKRKMTYKEQEAYDLGYSNGKHTAMCSPWVKTSDRLPTQEDAGSIGLVMVRNGNSIGFNNHYDVLRHPEYFAYWMPIPPLPEVEK